MISLETSHITLKPNGVDLEEANSTSNKLSSINNPFLNTFFHHYFFKKEIPVKRQLLKLVEEENEVFISPSKGVSLEKNQPSLVVFFLKRVKLSK